MRGAVCGSMALALQGALALRRMPAELADDEAVLGIVGEASSLSAADVRELDTFLDHLWSASIQVEERCDVDKSEVCKALFKRLADDLWAMHWDALLALANHYFPERGRQRGKPLFVVRHLVEYAEAVIGETAAKRMLAVNSPARMHEFCRLLAVRLGRIPYIGALRRMKRREIGYVLASIGLNLSSNTHKADAVALVVSAAMKDEVIDLKVREAVGDALGDALGLPAGIWLDGNSSEECPMAVQEDLCRRFGPSFAEGDKRRILAVVAQRVRTQLQAIDAAALSFLAAAFGHPAATLVDAMASSVQQVIPAEAAEQIVRLNATGLADECCRWFAAEWMPWRMVRVASPGASSILSVPPDCPIDMEAATAVRREARDLNATYRGVVQRLGDDLAALSPHQLIALSKTYFPEVARHRGPGSAIVKRLLRVVPSVMSPEDAERIVLQRIRGKALLSELCRGLAARIGRMPWVEALRGMSLYGLSDLARRLGIRRPKTHNKHDLVAKILRASGDKEMLRKLLSTPEMRPQQLRRAQDATRPTGDCPAIVLH